MQSKLKHVCLLVVLVAVAGCGGATEKAEAPATQAVVKAQPTPDEQVAGLEQMCAEAGPAMAARQAEATLFDRVGGRDGLQVVVADTVRRHLVNEQIKHLLDGVDADRLTMLVTDFLVVGTGGEGEYHGRDMVQAHAHLNLSNADFLAAGGDLGASMDAAGWGDGEKQELLCAFVALRGQVVTQ